MNSFFLDSPVRKIRADVKKSPAITPNLPEDSLVSVLHCYQFV